MAERRRTRVPGARWSSLLLATLLAVVGLTTLPAGPAVAAPCDAPIVSPVACENTKTGNPQSEWGITGAGSTTIQGFATDISVDQGGTVGFKVDTVATSFRLDIYRMGYYNGMGARKVATLSATGNNNQPNCVTAAATGLVDCGNWRQSASWTVPGDAVSGIYFAKLVRTDGPTGSSHVFFVVRDDDGRSNMLFQTSDTTWQAYNAYGGNSLYTGSPAGRAYKVSYNRPFTTRQNAPEDWVFNAEYPMVRFLESNGFDLSYSTGVDTDRRGAELLEHKVFLSVGHDEYWSGPQRANVEAARAAGVHLAFFSGNESFWKTRWENSIDGSGTPYRTLVTYKETQANAAIDPADPPTWTGTWRDPRFSPPGDGGRPENALSGQMFMINCCAINMAVGAADGKMRFWRNTRVANLTGTATTTIGTNIIGYEWDEDLDNGFRPAGSFRLSQTQGSGDKLQDYGSTYAAGSATHSMTMYKAPSGALVFGAGTIQWAWALDSNHDRGTAAADTAAQQATVNLFADMGVQPTTLRTGLVAATASTDTVAATSAITAPTAGATLTPGSPTTVTGTAADTGGGRVGGVEVSTDNGATWHRATGRETWSYTFTPSTNGSTTIRSRATDDSGNIQSPTTAVTVTVGSGPATCPCTIWPSTATPAATDPDTSPVELGVKFRPSTSGTVTAIRYYKPTTATGTHVGTLWTSAGTKLGTATFTNETASGWQQASFSSPIAVTAGTTYVASYFAPSRYAVNSGYFTADTVRGPLTAPSSGSSGGNGVYRYGTTAGVFPTSSFNSENYWVDIVFNDAPDTTAPTVTSRAPAPGATDVAVGSTVSATFSEDVQSGSIVFGLTGPGGAVASTTAYNAATRTATLTPNVALAASTTYTATLSGATDSAGNQMSQVSWTFTTAAADTTAPTVTSRTPAPGATGVAVGSTVSAVFSEDVQSGSIVFGLTGPGGAVASTTAYNAATRTATLTPNAALAASTTYTATLSGARDPSGNVMAALAWTFTTGASTLNCPCTIWPSTATPAATDPDTSPVELGVKFRSNTTGYITGIRYYKPTTASGTHVGSIWTSAGARLGSVTFTNETASGWQQATFPNPIPVTAGTTYVASYFAPSRYAVTTNYFTADTTRAPLTAPSSASSGGNGVYRYTGAAGAFPNLSFNNENYWVDVVFAETADDTVAPTVVSRVPADGATGVAITTRPTATFSEGVVASSVSMVLRTESGQTVSSTTSYDAATSTSTLTPGAALAYSSTYTVTLSGAQDSSGNTMTPVTWSFQTAGEPPPPIDQGRGGPIAVVTSTANPSSSYLVEVVRAEGLNEFANVRNTDLSATTLAPYSVVVLGDVAITDAQVTALTDWVTAGGNLITMRPDSRLLGLAGLTAAAGTVSEGYLAVNAATEPGAGITTDTMQFHGAANRYTLNGATSIAGLYTTATASTGQPAVTMRSVGTNGGQVAVFAFDLARSVIQTRQGNPAWAGQNRDGLTPNRSNDLFFGGASADWVNLSKVAIPQADEQQRLLANLVTVMSRDRLPMPRFWYFPKQHKAVVVATGDDHATGGTAGRFSTYASASPQGCSVAQWECPRFSSFVYANSPLTDSQANSYTGQGFEVGLHPQNNCANFTSLTQLQSTYTSQLTTWRSKYASIASPTSGRYHCMVWSDWASQPKAELASGIRMDTNYYYYPGSWIADRPGFMNGSGIPMRFTDTDGTMIDVYQTNTAMTDESGQSYPFTPDTLLDRALGAQGYYGAFTTNLHTDQATTFESSQVLGSAQARNVPLVTARQLLTWTDGRNSSFFSGLSWSGSTLGFTIGIGTGATQLTAMLPTTGPGGQTLSSITRGGNPVSFTTMTVKGQQYAVFSAVAGAHQATYAAGTGGAAVTTARSTARSEDAATLSWRTGDPATTTVRIGTSPRALRRTVTVAERTQSHRLPIDGLQPGRRYYYRVVSKDATGKVRVWPAATRPPASFTTLRADTAAPRIRRVSAFPLPDGTARVTWTTDEPTTSRVRFGRAPERLPELRLDDRLTRRHTVVLTGLAADGGYWLRVASTDDAGNSAAGRPVRLRTGSVGVAVQTLEEFRTGVATGRMRLGSRGFGELTLSGRGTGRYLSGVVDTGQKVSWRRAVVDLTLPRGATVEVRVRTGSTSEPDATWSAWTSSVEKGAPLRRSGRFLQYQVVLTATGRALPAVRAVGFTHSGRSLRHQESPVGR